MTALTIVCHVPRNDRLDRVDPETVEGAEDWTTCQREWIDMNHPPARGALRWA